MANEAPGTQLVDCPKCDGRGSIRGFEHVAAGVCFCCGGSKTFTIDAFTATEAHQILVNSLGMTLNTVLRAADEGDMERAEYYAGCMVGDLRKVGTEAARAILEEIRQGRWVDDAVGHEHGRCDQATAAHIRSFIIDQGRAAA